MPIAYKTLATILMTSYTYRTNYKPSNYELYESIPLNQKSNTDKQLNGERFHTF